MDDNKHLELSKKEIASLDKQLARLEPKMVDAKHKYDELVSKYSELYEMRHPEKKKERIKEELYQAYLNSHRSLEQILSFMTSDEWDEW